MLGGFYFGGVIDRSIIKFDKSIHLSDLDHSLLNFQYTFIFFGAMLESGVWKNKLGGVFC